MAAQHQSQPAPYSNNFQVLPNGAPPGSGPVPGATPLLPNQGRVVQAGNSRVLCVADVRGNLKSLNDLAKQARADYIIHTGDFGFYDDRSLDRIAEKTLKHVAQYSPLISEDVRRQITSAQTNTPVKDRIPHNQMPLSQLPYFLDKRLSFDVPVYTVWGACEDVQVLEKLRSGEYKIDKLHVIDEAHSRLLDIGGVKLRLLGLGGAVVMHKLFDNGEGRTTIAGGQGTMWTTLLQMGELVDTANRVYDPSETRVLVTHASPAREGLLNQLAVTLKVDFSISAGLHFRYGSSYNEFSVNPTLDHYRGKLAASKASFNDVWETVKSEVEPAVAENEAQQKLLHNALDIVNRMPSVANGGNPFGGHVGPTAGQVDEMAFKNMWNFNLADAAFGWLVLDVEGGRIGTEMKAQGFNFAHRGVKNPQLQADMIKPSAPSPSATGVSTIPLTNPQPSQPRASAQAIASAVQQPATGNQQNRQTLPTRPQQVQQGSQPGGPATPQQAPGPLHSPSTAPLSQLEPVSSDPSVKPDDSLERSVETRTNGETSGVGALAEDKTGAKSTPTTEDKPSSGIFIQNVNSEEEVRNLFTEDDRAKIQRVHKHGKAFVAQFSSPEEMLGVLNNYPSLKMFNGPGKPNIRVFQDRPRQSTGYESWGSASRISNQQSGYRSGGASDSEGGRGSRGTYRSRGRAGGERGRGRGTRGSYNKGAQGEASATSPASPAPAASGGS